MTNTSEETAENRAGDQPQRSEVFAALFWLGLGVTLVIVVLVTTGFNVELLVPGVLLVCYGWFVLWDPELASSTAPWTGFVWIVLGLFTLVGLRFVDLYWTYEVTGILVGLFLVFVGLLGLFDL